MKPNCNEIIVKYFVPTPHDATLGLYEHTLGTITPDQAKQLSDAINNHHNTPNACINGIITQEYKTENWLHTFQTTDNELLITHLFWQNPKRPLCCNRKQTKNHVALTKMCARNLTLGKCRDEFMRNTLGKILFPNIYNNQK